MQDKMIILSPMKLWELIRATLPLDETPVYGRLTFPAKLAGARLQLS